MAGVLRVLEAVGCWGWLGPWAHADVCDLHLGGWGHLASFELQEWAKAGRQALIGMTTPEGVCHNGCGV